MLNINMADVMNVVNSIKPQLIAIGIIVLCAVVICIAVMKLKKPEKKLVRGTALMAMCLGIVIAVNSILLGPMSTMLDLVTGEGDITAETSKEAKELAVEIAEEGTILLENNGILPLTGGTKLNVFGWASTNPMLGGGGSGALNESYESVDLLQSLKNAGFETNTELSDFYVNYRADRPVVGMWDQDWTLVEPAQSAYSGELIENAKNFSDTAMIVISRAGGEGADLPNDMMAIVNGTYQDPDGTTYFNAHYDEAQNEGADWDEGDHYLQLCNQEEDLVNMVCENFNNVILVYNGMNIFEFGFIKDHPQIKGFIWAPPTGHVGMQALGEIVAGTVNPSGKLPDTMVYELEETPWWNNAGDFQYTNMSEYAVATDFFGMKYTETPSFINYVEGIYVGYKFYETAAAEGLIDYNEMVQYPFGYGLSYTSFTQTMGDIVDAGDTLKFDVTVTNTGSVAGKEVVQVYSNPPYVNGGVEKASANLVAFEKTAILQPGASETVQVTVDKDDLMSYDYETAGTYVLEAGDYVISVNADSHNVLDQRVYTVATTEIGTHQDETKAENRFDFANGDLTYLSRADGFANYAEATAAPASYELSAEAKATFYNNSNYLTAEATAKDEDANAADITTGAANGLKLVDMKGLDKNDAKWDSYMDQLSLDDMNAVISLGGYQTNGVESIGKVRTNDCDGPASINNNFTGKGSIGFPIGIVISATFNKDLAYRFGESIGKMADEMDVSGWYAPAMNIHRTAFAGRNFEYYSEDGMLSGLIAAQAVKGAASQGVYAYMKHFALNDQEGNRCGMLCTWSNEQAIREIYLKPFEKCVKDANCQAVMSSFNYVGNRWAGGCSELLNDVLRGEWGFDGFVETDYFGVYGYMSADQAIRNGTDLMLVNYPTETNDVRFRDTNGAKQAMRTSAKNILYVVANSRAYYDDNLNPGMAGWKKLLIGADVILGALFVCWELGNVKRYQKRKKEEQ